jgi:PAS domain S-box-containing protein
VIDPRDHIAELEAELARVRARADTLSDTLENAAVAIHCVGPNGIILWANQAEIDLLGYDRAEYIGRSIVNFHADRPAIDDILRRLAAHEVLQDCEARLRHKDGSLRHVLITSNGRWDGGRFLHTCCFTRDITARKRAEEDLREAHAVLGSLLHHSPLPVVVLTAEGLVTLWNAAAERVFGWTAGEVLGKPLPFIPKEKLDEHRAMRALDLQGQGFIEREIRRMRKDGRPIDLFVSTDQLRDETGAVKAIISVYLDSTDRKRAHEEVRRAGERLLFALDAAGMMAWEWTPDGDGVTRAGDLCRQLGLASAGVRAEYIRMVHPDDRQRVIDAFDRTLRDGVELDVEFHIVLPDGSIRWMSDRGRLVPSDAPQRVSGVMLDITARKADQEALRQSEQRFQNILDNSSAAVYLKDLEGRFLLVNRQFEKLFHAGRADLLGKTDYDLFPRENADRYRANDRQVIENNAPLEFEEVAPAIDGDRTYLSVKFPMRGANGVYALCGISTDITERLRLEAKLRESAKLESLGVLAGGVAHDFNNLLVGMVGNASLLQHEAPPGSPAREVLDSNVQAGERAAQLTRQMLAYAGRAQFALAPVDLSSQVRQIAKLLEAALPKHVVLRLRLAPGLPAIDADPGQLQQVVMNLILNAAEASVPPSGAVEVAAGVEEWSEAAIHRSFGGDLSPGRYIVLRVTDTGCGMDAATRSRIFDPFFTTKFTGRGLGLAATLGILRSHHAGIHVESAPGAGSTFTVLFPPSRSAAGAAAAAPEARRESAAAQVLVVDDEQTVRQVARLALERHGYRVDTVNDGQVAMDWLDEHRGEVDILLLDLAMPVCGGEVALAYVRDRYPGVAVVCSSGYSEGEASNRFGPGADAFLQKPYTVPQLLDAVRRGLESARQTGANRS